VDVALCVVLVVGGGVCVALAIGVRDRVGRELMDESITASGIVVKDADGVSVSCAPIIARDPRKRVARYFIVYTLENI
jgi:hypothetical protein